MGLQNDTVIPKEFFISGCRTLINDIRKNSQFSNAVKMKKITEKCKKNDKILEKNIKCTQ